MRKLSTLILFLFFVQTVVAQAPPWAWAVSCGDTLGYENVGAMTTDAAGNTYIGGVFNGAVTIFGNDTLVNTCTGCGLQGYIAKYDVNGVAQWVQGLFGPGNALIRSMTTDNAGNLVIAGSLSGSYITFGNDTLFYTFHDLFVAKYAPNGAVLWHKSCHGFNQSTYTYDGAVATNAAGEVFFTASYDGTQLIADNYTLSSTSLGPDVFVLKYDAAGNILQAIRVADPGYEKVSAIDVAFNGNVVIGGKFMGAYTFGNTTVTAPSNTNTDMYVATFSPALTPLSIGSCTGNGADELNDMKVDASGNAYIVGTTHSTTMIAGNDTLTATPSSDNVFVAKFNAAGWAQWGRIYGTNLTADNGQGIELDVNGYPTILGSVAATTMFGNYSTPAGIFIAKLDPNGNVAWVTSAGAGGWACSSDAVDHFYTAGTINDTALFSPITVIPNSHYDVVVAQMDFQTGITAHAAGETTLTFPNPTTGIVSLSGIDPATANTIIVYNLLGEMVHSEFLKLGINTLDLSGLPKGVYVLEAAGEAKHTYKVVLQ